MHHPRAVVIIAKWAAVCQCSLPCPPIPSDQPTTVCEGAAVARRYSYDHNDERQIVTSTLTVLGFRGGRPDATSSCSGYLVRHNTSTILVDCGPGIVGQLLSRGVEHELDAVVLTHLHQDHCLDIVPLAYIRLLAPGGLPRIPLFVPEDSLDHLHLLDRWVSASNDPVTGGPLATVFDVRPMPRDGATALEVTTDAAVTAFPAEHPVPSAALRFRLGADTLAFSSDTGWCAGVLDAARGADLFVCEAAFLDPAPGMLAKFGHLSPDLAGRLAVQAQVGHLLLTHLSGQDDPACLDAAQEAIRKATDESDAAVPCTLAGVGLSVDVGAG